MPGLRDRKKDETRERLLRAAVELVAQRGYQAVTVDEIAAAADVSPRTFFRYYPTKGDVLFADQDVRLAQLPSLLAERPPGETVLRAVRRFVLGFVGEVAADTQLYVTRARLVFGHPQLQAHVLRRFAQLEAAVAAAAADERGADPDTDVAPRVVAAAAVAAVRSTAMTWLARDGRGDPAAIANEAFDLLERGLAP